MQGYHLQMQKKILLKCVVLFTNLLLCLLDCCANVYLSLYSCTFGIIILFLKNVSGHSRRSFSNVSVTSEPLCDVIAASRHVKASSGETQTHRDTYRQTERRTQTDT